MENENGSSSLADLRVSVEAGAIWQCLYSPGYLKTLGRAGGVAIPCGTTDSWKPNFTLPSPRHAPTLIFTSFGASFFTSLSSLSPNPEWAEKENFKSIL